MKKILLAAVAALVLSACSKTQTYTIEGSFDIPETYQIGDTTLERGPIAGLVRLIGLDGEVIDSVLIVDEKFTFSGVVDPKRPYFAYLVSDFAAGMFAVEPGVMKAVVTDPVTVSGTPTNDAITALMSRVDLIGNELYEELQILQAESDEALDQDKIMEVYGRYSAVVNDLVDSTYHANTENLIGVYCANVMSVQAQTVEELESIIEPYSDYVKNSELIQQHFTFIKEAESYAGGEDYLGN